MTVIEGDRTYIIFFDASVGTIFMVVRAKW